MLFLVERLTERKLTDKCLSFYNLSLRLSHGPEMQSLGLDLGL